jgi:molecular chaperone DnaK
MGRVIGIDLGTTNSVIALYEGSRSEVIASANGERTTPSVVGQGSKGEWLVGEVAKRQLATRPEQTFYSMKRLVGLRLDEVADITKALPYKVIRGEHELACIEVDGQPMTPVEISAMILRALRDRAEEVLGESIEKAVITVPAYFNDAQRQATRDAGKIAGLDVLRIINEPTAAALAYGLEGGQSKSIAVYDLGGGTFDISILNLADDVIEVLSTGGDTQLGGDDFDQAIIDWARQEFLEQAGVDLLEDPMARGRLKEAAERAKIELSQSLEANLQVPFVATVDGVPQHLDLTLSRARFERLVQPLIDNTLESCLSAMEDAGMQPLDVDDVVLVGGGTRVPSVQRAVEELFAKMPNKSVHPDEVVALGAAIQAGVLDGTVEDVLLLDVIPLSIGLETLGGVVTRVLDRNTTVPARRSQVFSTVQDNQKSVNVHVVQGEREMAVDNRSLARFELTGIPAAKKGVPQVEVTFDVDADGILKVSAKDLGTGAAQEVCVKDASNLSEDEVVRMLEEAEERHDDDLARRRRAESRHVAEELLLNVEDTLAKSLGPDVSKSETERLTAYCDRVRDALEAPEASFGHDELVEATEALQDAAHRFADLIYQGSH